jgi:hypothetical protein
MEPFPITALPLAKFLLLQDKLHPSSISTRDPCTCANLLPSLSYKKPCLAQTCSLSVPSFPGQPGSSCLSLNPALGHEIFLWAFFVSGIFPNRYYFTFIWKPEHLFLCIGSLNALEVACIRQIPQECTVWIMLTVSTSSTQEKRWVYEMSVLLYVPKTVLICCLSRFLKM